MAKKKKQKKTKKVFLKKTIIQQKGAARAYDLVAPLKFCLD